MTGEDELLRAVGEAAREEREGEVEIVPLTEAQEIAMAEAALAALGPRAAGPKVASVSPPPAAAAPRGTAIRKAPARRAWVPAAAAGLAMAAGVTLWLRTRSAEVELPTYRLTWEASSTGASEWRGAGDTPGPVARVKPDDVLTFTLRPAVPTTVPLEARVVVTHAGHTRRLDVPVQISPQGVARVSAKASALFEPATGEHALDLFVSAKGAMPGSFEGASAIRGGEVKVTFE